MMVDKFGHVWRWPVSFRPPWACRCRGSVWPMWRGRPSTRDWWHRSREHRLALAARGRDPPLAAPLLDLSARSAIRGQGRTDPGPVWAHLAGASTARGRICHLHRQETSIQARVRIHASLPVSAGKPMRVEHEYGRAGAWAYLAALDVHRAKVFGLEARVRSSG